MALAATPVVAVLKSMWLLPRTRALNESDLGISDSDMLLLKQGEIGNKQCTDQMKHAPYNLCMVDINGLGCVCRDEGGRLCPLERYTGFVVSFIKIKLVGDGQVRMGKWRS